MANPPASQVSLRILGAGAASWPSLLLHGHDRWYTAIRIGIFSVNPIRTINHKQYPARQTRSKKQQWQQAALGFQNPYCPTAMVTYYTTYQLQFFAPTSWNNSPKEILCCSEQRWLNFARSYAILPHNSVGKLRAKQTLGFVSPMTMVWVCLKIGYIPNYSHLIGIMISKTIGFRGTLFSDTPVWMKIQRVAKTCLALGYSWPPKQWIPQQAFGFSNLWTAATCHLSPTKSWCNFSIDLRTYWLSIRPCLSFSILDCMAFPPTFGDLVFGCLDLLFADLIGQAAVPKV